MTLFELRKWMWDEILADRWYLIIDDQAHNEPYSLEQISELREQHPQKILYLVHESRVRDDPIPWLKLTRCLENQCTRHLDHLRKWLWEHEAQDLWWLAIDDFVLEHRVSLDGVVAYQHEHPNQTLYLMNCDVQQGGGQFWVELESPIVSTGN